MTLTARERNLVFAGLLIAAAVAVYTLIHAPLAAKRAEATGQLASLQAELRREQAKVNQAADLLVRKADIVRREQTIDAWVPGKNAAGMFVYHLALAEQASGTRIRGIKLLERRDVTSAPQAAVDAQGQASPMPALTVVRLDLQVDGTFASQLLFNQAMEDMPLFLNTDRMSLKRPAADLAGALKTARDGAFAEAVQALQFSPALGGTYTVNIYFKREKPGPDGEGARFSSMPGRVDPFTVDGVEEFLRELLRYYPGDLKDPMLPPQLG
jgi:hypothetical protein